MQTFALFARLYGARGPRFYLALVVVVGAAVLGIVPAFSLRGVVDGVVQGAPGRGLVLLCVVAGVAVVLQEVARLCADRYFISAGLAAARRVRARIFRRVQAMPVEYHVTRPGQEVNERISQDLSIVGGIFAHSIQHIVGDGVFVVVAIVAMFSMSPVLAAALLALTVGMTWAQSRFIAARTVHAENARAAMSEVLRVAGASLRPSGIVDERTFGTWHRSRGAFEAASEEQHAHTRRERLVGATSLATASLGLSLVAPLLYLGVVNGWLDVTFGTAIAMVALHLQMAYPAQGIISSVGEIRVARAQAERVREYVDLPAEPDPPRRDVAGGRGERVDLLRVENVGYTYPGAVTPTLHDVSVTLRRDRLCVVTGASGVGKSTLLRIVGGLQAPSEGTVVADPGGRPVDTRLGIVVTQETVFDDRTVLELLRDGDPDLGPEEALVLLRRVRFDVATLRDGLDTRVGELGLALSGGERRRLGIARALAADPPVLCLDEPDANLDEAVWHDVLELLRTLVPERVVVMITHRSDAVRPEDQHLHLHAGGAGAVVEIRTAVEEHA